MMVSKRVGAGRASAAGKGLQFALTFGWLVLIVWFEVGEFYWSVSSCRWSTLESVLVESSKRLPPEDRPSRVLLIADPQVIDFGSPTFRKRPLRALVSRFVVDTFLRKSWSIAMRLRPDAVVFLGDMMETGRAATSEQSYQAYAERFKAIFRAPETMPLFFIPGNRDVGLGPSRSFSPYARERYHETFGDINYTFDLAGHTFVLIDAPLLAEEDYRRHAAQIRFGEWQGVEGGTIDFVDKLGAATSPNPRILLSHIPLLRRERPACGPLRQDGFISNGAGLGYQKLLGKETSNFLVDKIKPALMFSADDQDVCDYTHRTGLREVTVKTFSMALGVSRPGFQMLSLVSPDLSDSTLRSTSDATCNLPDQLSIYRIYTTYAVLTILFLLLVNARRALRKRGGASRPAPLNLDGLSSSSSSTLFSGGPVSVGVGLNLMSRSSSANLLAHGVSSPRSSVYPFVSSDSPALPTASRRASRSMPTSPRLGAFANLANDDDTVLPSVVSTNDGGYLTPSHRAKAFVNGPSASYSQVDVLDSPGTLEDGVSSERQSYFFPASSGDGGMVGLGIHSGNSSPGPMPLPNAALPGGIVGSVGGGNRGGARPGVPRRPSRHIVDKDATGFKHAPIRRATGGSGGLIGGLAAELRSDLLAAKGGSWSSRRAWWILTGSEGLLVRWAKDCFAVFWPAAVAFVVVNAFYWAL